MAMYSVSAASRLTGVPASTLRTWERRYGLPRPDRSGSGRRLFGEDDLAAVRRMASLIEAGAPPAEAARSALLGEAVPASGPDETPVLGEEAARLVEAAVDLDEVAARAVITAAVERVGWAGAIEQVMFPALHEAGLRWQHGDVSVAHEHFLSLVVRTELLAAVSGSPSPTPGRRPLLLACPEDEQHELGMVALWLLLRQADAPVLCLGADVPSSELLAVVMQTDCAAVCLSIVGAPARAQAERTARAILKTRPRVQVFLGGPGMAGERDDSVLGVRLPHDLGAAVEVLTRALDDAPPRTRRG